VNQKLAVKILEKYGHTVEIAENGSLAVDAFKGRVAQGKPFDIILVCVFRPSFYSGLAFAFFLLMLTAFFCCRWMFRCLLWGVWRRPS